MAWIWLAFAGLLEIVWAVAMKQSEGFTRLWPSVLTLVARGGSVLLLGLAMKTLPLGTAYTVWTGIGAVGTFLVGVVFFHDPTSFGRWLGAMLIISGVIVMKLSSGH